MESNNLLGFQNSDLSNLTPNDNRYIKAKNFRPLTELGSSNNALVNIKGNRCDLTIPRVRSVYKLKIGIAGTVALVINGSSTAVITVDSETTTEDIVNEIRQLSNCWSGVSNPTGVYSPIFTFDVAYDDNFIYIHQQPINKQCSAFSSMEPTVLSSDYAVINFIDENEDPIIGNVKYIDNTNYSKSVVIGSTYIGLDQYLFTCDITNANESGEIWRLRYDETTDVTTLTLLHIGYLNFSVNYPIPPTATKGRYESDLLQRIYWSDNNNPVRSINVMADNLMALSAEIINLRSSVEMNIPTLKLITDGNGTIALRTDATYQCAYRLTKFNGSVTNYSVPSNIVSLLPGREDRFIANSPYYCSINGIASTVNKSITWTIDGIDTNYDNIEFVIIKRFAPNKDTFLIYNFDSKPINGLDSIDIEYTNDEDTETEITLSEFLIENVTITHCKTIDEKDNRLFFGNVKNEVTAYLDTFDTRAYRFPPVDTTFEIMTYEADASSTTYTDYTSVPTDADALCRYNLGFSTEEDINYTSDHKYQRNSTVIGGSGTNISYKFGSLLLNTDQDIERPNQPLVGSTNAGTNNDEETLFGLTPLTNRYGFRIPTSTNTVFDNLAPDQTYTFGNQKSTMGIANFNGHYRTGQCNEIYRYGILFKAKNGESSFVKWVGDIKFPHYSDSVAPGYEGIANDGTQCTDFRSIYKTVNEAYVNIPYIIFDVIIPTELASIVSSFEIVVVPREEADKTIISQGLINQVAAQSVNYPYYKNPASHYLRNSLSYVYMNPPEGAPNDNNFNATNSLVAYHSFKDLCYPAQIDYQVDDKLIVVEKIGAAASTGITYLWPEGTPEVGAGSGAGTTEPYFGVAKFYNWVNMQDPSDVTMHFKIDEGNYWGIGEGEKAIGTGFNFSNICVSNNGVGTPDETAHGGPTVILALDTAYRAFNWTSFNDGNNVAGAAAPYKLFGVHFRPSRLSRQYGGRTFADRANNEYISTGAFYKVEDPSTKTIKVFGGDIFYGVLDIQKALKVGLNPSGDTSSHSQSWFIPVQSVYNVDLRDGIHVNSDMNSGTSLTGTRYFDTYAYTLSYSYRNSIIKYVPQPVSFNNNNVYVNRIYWTDPKFNNSPTDDWSTLPANNNYEVSGNQGPITALITLNNEMYVIQENAIGRLLINQSALITPDGQGNQPLQVGTGSVLTRHNYYSVDAGSKHQWSVASSPTEIVFFDSLRKKLYSFNGEQLNPISDLGGHRGFVNKAYRGPITFTDNPILGYGILSTYDHKNNEFLFTFLNKLAYIESIVDDKYTLAYSTLIGKFTGFYDFTPYIYINNKVQVYSLPDYNGLSSVKLYIHDKGNYGKFYDVVYPSTLKTVINSNPAKTKIYDSLSWISDARSTIYEYIDDVNDYIDDDVAVPKVNSTFNEVRLYNEYQNTDWIDLTVTDPITNLRKTEQGFNIQVPRNKVNYDSNNIDTKSIFDPTILTKTTFGERMRDKYLIADFKYDNTNNYRFTVNNIKANFRISDR